jgi:MoxR-like ATPase
VCSAAEIVEAQDRVPKVRIDPAILEYVLDVVDATRHHDQLHLGVSPRGSLALTAACQASAVLAGRDYVVPDDVKNLIVPVCAHRIISKSYLHNGDADSTGRILKTILDQIPTPR